MNAGQYIRAKAGGQTQPLAMEVPQLETNTSEAGGEGRLESNLDTCGEWGRGWRGFRSINLGGGTWPTTLPRVDHLKMLYNGECPATGFISPKLVSTQPGHCRQHSIPLLLGQWGANWKPPLLSLWNEWQSIWHGDRTIACEYMCNCHPWGQTLLSFPCFDCMDLIFYSFSLR